MPPNASLRRRVQALADQRSEEGYMAEVKAAGRDLLLIEHHCPICRAAESCQGFCRAELQIFRSVLGDDVEVERRAHLLSGDQRCAYLVRRKPAASTVASG